MLRRRPARTSMAPFREYISNRTLMIGPSTSRPAPDPEEIIPFAMPRFRWKYSLTMIMEGINTSPQEQPWENQSNRKFVLGEYIRSLSQMKQKMCSS